MEESIHIQLRKVINNLRLKVYNNIREIESNDGNVRTVLNEPVSETRTSRLKKWLDKNRTLMDENKDLVALQLSMLNYLSKYYEDVDENQYDKKELFQLTIDNLLPFDDEHPCYDDDEFRNMLLNYYTEKEDYEMCANILKK